MDPLDHERNNGKGASYGDREHTHADAPIEGYRWMRSVVENSSENLTVVDPDGTLRYASPAFGRMLGYDPEEAAGTMNVLDYVHPDDLSRVLEETQTALSEGDVTTNRVEYRFRHKDGSWRWVESVGTYLLDDPDVKGVVVQTREITERKEVEERLKETEERHAALLSNAPAVVYRCLNEPDWPEVYISDYALELTGYPPEDLLIGGMVRYGDLIVEEDRGRVWEEVQKALAERTRFKLRYSIRHRDGTVRHVEEYGQGLYDQDGEVGAIEGLVYDVTEAVRVEERLRKTEERYRTLVEQIPAVTYIDKATDGPDEPIYTSPQIEGLLGYTAEEWLEGHLWTERLHSEDKERILAADERFEKGGEPFSEEYRLLARDGSVVWVREDAALVRNQNGEPLYFQGIILDITKQKEAERALRESEERLHMLSDAAFEGILVSDKGVILETNRALADMFGYEPSETVGRAIVEFVAPEDQDLVRQKVASGAEEPYEARGVRKDGKLLNLEVRGRAYRYQGRKLRVTALRDITERKEAEKRLEHRAFHDSLTDLPNRYLLLDRLEHALQRTRRRRDRLVAVLLIDLDNFKGVNDSLGHGIGDTLLVSVAERLKGCLRPEDTLVRFGGDEFVVLLEDVEGSEVAVRVAQRIVDSLNDPFVLESREMYVSASVGIAIGEDRTKTPEDLLRDADTAMYWAKEQGSGYSEFDPAMGNRALRRLEAADHLRRAIQQEDFVVHYQPIVSLQTGAVLAMEALVRWEHPERGPLDADECVALAEDSGLMVPIGEWVLREACLRARRWHEMRPRTPPLVMSVNISVQQLSRSDLIETVEAILRETGLEGAYLTLDVTETTYVEEFVGNTAALDSLKKLGVKISLDDFGTGFSSLSYLKRLPADIIKIDRSFVKGFGEDAEDTAIVQMVIELAHTLGLEVVAEGVETEEQARQLREIGCDMAQGFHFAKPLPPEAVTEYLAH